MTATDMRRFWDESAREDAFYFVDSGQRYGRPDTERFWAQGEENLDYMFELLEVTPDPEDVVVEIGCGVGRMTRVLAARCRRVLALDISSEMLARARELNPGLQNVDWLLGDGASLADVEDGAVDACVSVVVFQHIPDPQVTYGYVSEIGRVLRPGGWAAIQVSNDPSVHAGRPRLRDRLRAFGGRASRRDRDPAWRGSAVDLDRLRGAAAAAGLAVEKVWGEGTLYCLLRLRRGSGDG